MKLLNNFTFLAVMTFLSAGSTSPVKSATRSIAEDLEASKAIIASLPAEAPANEIAFGAVLGKRAFTHVYVCTDINFQGRCQNLDTYTQHCYNLGNGFDNSISSLGPDQGTTCTFWNDNNCGGSSKIEAIFYPGISDLRAYDFNDKISSYTCY